MYRVNNFFQYYPVDCGHVEFRDDNFQVVPIPKFFSIKEFLLTSLSDYFKKLYLREDTPYSVLFNRPVIRRTFLDIYRAADKYVDSPMDQIQVHKFTTYKKLNPEKVYEALIQLIDEGKVSSFICIDIGKRVYTFITNNARNYARYQTPGFLSEPVDEFRYDFKPLLEKYPNIKTDETKVEGIEGKSVFDDPDIYGFGHKIKQYLLDKE